MKCTTHILSLVVAAAFVTSCTRTNGKSPAPPKQSEAKTEPVDTARSLTDYAYAQKTAFVDKMKSELVTIQEELDRLGTKVDKVGGATKTDAKAKLAAVREQWVRVKKQLDQAEGATESTWDDVKGGSKKAYGDLEDSVTTMRQWLSDKLAP